MKGRSQMPSGQHVQNPDASLTSELTSEGNSAAFQLLSDGNLSGFQEFDCPSLARILVRLKPNRFDDLVIAAALWKMPDRQVSNAFSHSRTENSQASTTQRLLQEVTSATRGALIFKDQVVELLLILTRSTVPEAVEWSRALARGFPGRNEELGKTFLKRVHFSHGLSRAEVAQLLRSLRRASTMAVDKAHAACQARTLLHLAGLKAQHLPEFRRASAELAKQHESMDADSAVKWVTRQT